MTRYTPQWLQQGTYSGGEDRRLINALWPTAASTGLAVSTTTGMTLNVAAGQASVPTANGTGSTLCTSTATEQVILDAAPTAGLNRYDLVIVRPRGNDLDGGSNNDFIFDKVTGTAAAGPVAPATPAGTLALARVYVAGASATIGAGAIVDLRPGRLATYNTLEPKSGLFTGTTDASYRAFITHGYPQTPTWAICTAWRTATITNFGFGVVEFLDSTRITVRCRGIDGTGMANAPVQMSWQVGT